MAKTIEGLATDGENCIAVVCFERGKNRHRNSYYPPEVEFRIVHFLADDARDFFRAKRLRGNKKINELYTVTGTGGYFDRDVCEARDLCYEEAQDITAAYPHITEIDGVPRYEQGFVDCIERIREKRREEERRLRAAVTPETEASPIPRRARL